MSHYLLFDGAVREVRIVKREDGNYEDVLSGLILSPEQFERCSLYSDEKEAYQGLYAWGSTIGNLSPYWSYTKSRLA